MASRAPVTHIGRDLNEARGPDGSIFLLIGSAFCAAMAVIVLIG